MSTSLSATHRSEAAESIRRTPRFYRPELDALRFFAFLSVFICHGPSIGPMLNGATWQRLIAENLPILIHAGSFGLCLFFLLSAYLITELLIKERERTGTIHLKAFYVRRILRIWPLYYLGVAIGVVCSIYSPALYGLSWLHLSSLLFFFGWFPGPSLRSPIALLWSISIEELFYLIWPSVAKAGGVRLIVLTSLLIVPLSFTATFFSSDPWRNPVIQFLFFALGGLLAVGLRDRPLSMPAALRIVLFLTALPLAFVAASYIGGFRGPLTGIRSCLTFVLAALSCLLVFFSFLGLPEKYLPKPVLYLGRISYGLYVFHYCFILLAEHLIRMLPWRNTAFNMLGVYVFALTGTIAAAALSYRYFETPFLKWKDRFTFVLSRPT